MFKLYKYQMKDNARRLKVMGQRLDLTPYFFGENIYILGRMEGRGLEYESNRFYQEVGNYTYSLSIMVWLLPHPSVSDHCSTCIHSQTRTGSVEFVSRTISMQWTHIHHPSSIPVTLQLNNLGISLNLSEPQCPRQENGHTHACPKDHCRGLVGCWGPLA